MQPKGFALLDYIAVGGYFALLFFITWRSARKASGSEGFTLAGRSMSRIPAGLSIVVTFISAISWLGMPSEYFTHGITLILMQCGVFLAIPFLVRYFIPLFVRLDVVSAYEYLERRFNLPMRLMASGTFIALRITWMGVAIYVTSLAVNQMSGLDMKLAVILIGGVSTVIAATGGLKAVIQTNMMQFFILFAAIFVVIFTVLANDEISLVQIFQIAHEQGRTRLFDFSVDPYQRVTTWGCLVGGFILFMSNFGTDQMAIQNYLSTRSVQHARHSIVVTGIGVFLMAALEAVMAFAVLAYYTLNPEVLPAGIAGDRVLPYFISHQLPAGLVGVILAAILAATITSVESGIHAVNLALVTDFYGRLGAGGKRRLSAMLQHLVSVLVGLVAMTVAMSVSGLGSIIEIANKLVNSFSGPMLGCFVLGIFTRRASPWATFCGFIAGLIATYSTVSLSKVSFLWYPLVGFSTTVLVSLLLSLFEQRPEKRSIEGLTAFSPPPAK